MKFLAVLAFAATAAAQATSSFLSVGSAIDVQVKSLDALIKAYTGGNGAGVTSQATVLLKALQSGASAVNGFPAIPELADALALLDVYTPLANDVATVVNDLIAKKDIADADGLCDTAESILKQESAAAIALAQSVVAKLSNGAPDVATLSVISPITSALNKGIAAYSSCPPTSGGGPTGGSTPPSSGGPTGGSSPAGSSSPPTQTQSGNGPASTCTSNSYNSNQVKKCLQILSSAALRPGGSYDKREL